MDRVIKISNNMLAWPYRDYVAGLDTRVATMASDPFLRTFLAHGSSASWLS